ncbi:MAG: tetratricopeptide repeat protein [Terriglobia bacterium]|nr:tetratricopeptide repeat protein [Terriglobia bacterium]
MKKRFAVFIFCSLLILPAALLAQTFEIPGQTPQAAGKKSPAQKAGKRSVRSQETQSIGWGSSLQVGQLARAARQALAHNNPAQAATFAQRAVQTAPRDAKLWFLLGYTSRLANRNQASLDAYQHGLKLSPGSVDGLSGLAQTYARMGNIDQAKRLLMEIVSKNPRRQNDLLMAGELYMQTGDPRQGIRLLQRAEDIKPTTHAELMMAVAYLKLNQPSQAKQLLDKAKRRDPKNTAIFRAIANYYRGEHDYKSAIATLRSAPRMTPELLADLGYTYGLNGDKKQAADTYIRAANADPKQIGYQLSAAQALITGGQLEQSRQFIARAETLDANNYRLHAIKGFLARTEDRPADAIREYSQAIALLPQGGVPEGDLYPISLRLNLAELYRQQNDDANSRQQIVIAEQMVNKLNLQGAARAEFLRVRASIFTAEQNYTGAEKDLREAMRLDPSNTNITLQYANLLWKTNRKPESRKLYNAILAKDQNNHFALEALGYMAREDGDNNAAQGYFERYARAYPKDYVPYLALGDLYTAEHQYARANASYEEGYKRSPDNALIIANAANAAIAAQQIDLAGTWVARATGKAKDDARVMREDERYLFHKGKYLESAQLGYKVLQKLPRDRNGSVYLVYALYNLGRYDEVLTVAHRYENILPKEPNFPLLLGHVHKQVNLLDEAVNDYGRAIARDPKMVDAYVNRGYVRNDLQDPEESIRDFDTALKLEPDNGIAHLGLAFADLELRKGKSALDEVNTAEKLLGESGATHLARATAYRQMRLLDQAEKEYEVALKYAPDDLKLHMALADTQYYARHYPQAVQTLTAALRLSPDDPLIYSEMAHSYAQMHRRNETLQYVQAAERAGGDRSSIFLNTGEALMELGDQNGAMQRFARALQAPDADKVAARLLIARLFVRQGRYDDAREQVGLGFAEARVGEASPVTADDLIEAANVFLSMSDFDLAQLYFERAKAAGAADQVVAIGLANAYLAQGKSNEAQVQLASLGSPDDLQQNYDYNLALGSLYRQQHDNLRALGAYARANLVAGNDDVAERAMQDVAASEGMRVTDKLSVGGDFSLNGIYNDVTIYNLDRQLFGVTTPSHLPPPRAEYESRWMSDFKYHQFGLPVISGFVQLRNARGPYSVPSEALIVDRDTYDYSVNGALNPQLHLGALDLQFNTGLQYTWRRDHKDPVDLNQNLFRQFVYFSSNSLFDWVSFRGAAFHETGPFLDKPSSSRELGASLQFLVGRPWGRTQLLTGYSVRDLQFSPIIREFFTTTTSVGLQHRFGKKLKIAALGEYIRSWRAQDFSYFLAQGMRPAGQFEYDVNDRWNVTGNFSFSRGMGFHDYDNVQNSLLINYQRPLHRKMDDGGGEIPVEYPLRFSFGIQSANYFNFTGPGSTTLIRPVFQLGLF